VKTAGGGERGSQFTPIAGCCQSGAQDVAASERPFGICASGSAAILAAAGKMPAFPGVLRKT
jgi:hypothetical protein